MLEGTPSANNLPKGKIGRTGKYFSVLDFLSGQSDRSGPRFHPGYIIGRRACGRLELQHQCLHRRQIGIVGLDQYERFTLLTVHLVDEGVCIGACRFHDVPVVEVRSRLFGRVFPQQSDEIGVAVIFFIRVVCPR